MVYRSQKEIRDLLVERSGKAEKFPAADGHWRMIPDEARGAIERQALAQTQERRTPTNAAGTQR